MPALSTATVTAQSARYSLVAVALAVVVGCQAPAPPEAPAAPAVTAAPAVERGPSLFPTFRVREWTLDHGLPGLVTGVAQTSDGYLWVATAHGAFRFDGARFVGFTSETTPVLAHDRLTSIYADGNDVWLGAEGPHTYRLRDGEWQAFDASPALADGWIQGFGRGRDGLWVVGAGDRVGRFVNGAWTPVEQRIRPVWTPFTVDASGTPWTYLPPEAAPDQPVARIKDGVVARWDGARFVPPGGLLQEIGFEPSPRGPLLHVATDTVQAGRRRIDVRDASGAPLGWFWQGEVPLSARLVDRRGRLWLEASTPEEEGALRIVRDGVEIARIEPEGSTYVDAVFEDRQGSVWVVIPSTGLIQVVESPFRTFTEADGAPVPAHRASLDRGTVVVSSGRGTRAGSLLDVRGDTVRTRRHRVAPGSRFALDGDVGAHPGWVAADGRGRRFGAYHRHLFRIDDGLASVVPGVVAHGWWEMWFADPSDPDVLWLSDEHNEGRYTLSRFSVETGRLLSHPTSAPVNDLEWTADGHLWIAMDDGLERRSTHGASPADRQRVLDGVPVLAIEKVDGALWLATERGLARVRDGAVDVLGPEHGAPADLTYVLADDHGMLWLTSTQAFHRVSLASAERALDAGWPLDIVTLLPSTGHLGASDRVTQAVKAPDGGLWIPSERGVTRIDPELYAEPFAAPPTVIVEAIRGDDGQAFALDAPLPVGARTLTIDYTATDLAAPERVQFRTRLLGHRDAWSDKTTERSVTYGGLGPGTHTFEVRAMNGAGVWSAPVRATVLVPHHAWETWWFALLVGIALVGAIVGIVRVRVRRLTERQRTLEQTVLERTAELYAEKETVSAQAQRLLEADQLKTRFFTNVSHEFRTPLTLTIGPLADLDPEALPPDARGSVDLALRNSRRLLRLTNQLLDAARLEAGEMTLHAQPIELGARVRATALSFAPLAERRQIRFDTSAPSDPLTVWADPDKLDAILVNLLSNAFKFTPEGGAVEVAVRQGPQARVVVRDTGPGIPPEELAHVFDRFYRVEEAGGADGSGIGLSLARDYAALHGGDLWAESVPGRGSVFTVSLPLGRDHLDDDQIADGASETSPPPAPHPLDVSSTAPASLDPADDRTTVLIADDNADIRAYVRSHLCDRYRVLEASDGDQALVVARESTPDLIVSDVMMPGLDGVELVRALRTDAETDFIPVILLTAKAEQANIQDGLDAGADDYVVKPFVAATLRARVDNLIASRQRLRLRFSGAPAVEVETSDPVLTRIRSAIQARISDSDFTVEDLADALDMTRSTVYRKIKAAADMSPTDLIRTVRLEEARALLEAGDGLVSEVAYAVGFRSVSHFSRAFRAQHGIAPSSLLKSVVSSD